MDLDFGGIIPNTTMKTDETCINEHIIQPIAHYNRVNHCQNHSNHHQHHNRNMKETTAQTFNQQNKYCQAYQNHIQHQSNLNLGCCACLLDPEGAMTSILRHHEDNCPFQGPEFNQNKQSRDGILQYEIKY
eukprot:1832093-Ditylum_brightwellii.AAC.1